MGKRLTILEGLRQLQRPRARGARLRRASAPAALRVCQARRPTRCAPGPARRRPWRLPAPRPPQADFCAGYEPAVHTELTAAREAEAMREGAAVCMPNLDVDLVFLDPKTRSMGEVPRPACPALRRRTGCSGRQCLRPRFDRPTRRRRRCRRRPLQRLLLSSAPPSTSTEAAAHSARTEPLRARAAIRGGSSLGRRRRQSHAATSSRASPRAERRPRRVRAAPRGRRSSAARRGWRHAPGPRRTSTQTEEHTAWRWPRHMCV